MPSESRWLPPLRRERHRVRYCDRSHMPQAFTGPQCPHRCTTTPVVRRKPQRKPKNSLVSADSNEETSPTAAPSAPAPDAVLPIPPTSATTSGFQLGGDASFAPVASTSQVPYTRPALAITGEETLSFQPSVLAERLSLYLQGLVDRTAWVDQTLEPALVEHLYDCKRFLSTSLFSRRMTENRARCRLPTRRPLRPPSSSRLLA